jgi:hypothetical protein
MKNGKALYPGGRHIIIAGEELVLDEKNPYWDKLFPVDLLDWHRNPDSAWGEGEIEDLRELQRLLNKLIAMIVENGLMMTNAIWIGDANALEPDEWDKIDNVPGLKIKKRPGTELRREIGAPLPTSLFSAVQYVEAAIEKLSGNTDVVAGRTPGEVKSGIAIEALQTAAMAIIRLKARAVEQLLSNIGQKMIARIFQFETEDRMMWRLTSEREFKAYKFFKSMLRDKKLFPNGPQDAWRDFLFKVRPGSSLAMNKWQESLIAMQMYQAQPKPLIDRQGVLEKMDWEGRTELLARLEQQEAEELQQQIALMQMQQGGQVPSGQKGGSAPGVSDIRSPHAAQGMQEAQRKGTGGI